MRLICFTGFFFLVLCSCNRSPAPEQTTDTIPRPLQGHISAAGSLLIVPGKSIGQTHIDDSADSVFSRLGKPGFADAAMGKSWTKWYSADRADSTCIYFSTEMGSEEEYPRVKLVRITASSFSTAGNLHTRMPWSEIRKSFGSAVESGTYTEEGQSIRLFEDADLNTAFEVDQAGKCVAISVYAQGIRPSTVYLALHPDLKPVSISQHE